MSERRGTGAAGREASTRLWGVGLSLALFLVAFAAYGATAARTVGGSDSGELATALWSLGVAHPPGFPLYVWLGHAFLAVFPWGAVAHGASLFSAFGAALGVATVAPIGASLHRLVRASREAMRRASRARRGRASAGLGSRPPGRLEREDWLVGAALALAFGASPLTWQWATVTEVYGLELALAGSMVAAALWGLVTGHLWRGLCLAALLGGLGLSTHLLLTAVLAPGLVLVSCVLLFRRPRVVDHPWRGLLLLALLALLPAVVLYGSLVPLSRSQPAIDWGHPADLTRLWWHVTGKQYQVNLFGATWASVVGELHVASRLLPRAVGVPVLALAVLGSGALSRRAPRAAAIVVGGALVGIALAVVYDIEDDQEAYYLTAVQMLYGAAAAGIALLDRSGWARGLRRPAPRWMLTALVAAWAVGAAAVHLDRVDRSEDQAHDAYGRDVLATVPGETVLLTADWQLYAPLLYLQRVEGRRPDVVAIDVLLWQNRPWYDVQLTRAYPDVLPPDDPAWRGFIELLWRFEAGTLPVGDRSISRAYGRSWRAALGRWRSEGRPVCATPDALRHLVGFGVELRAREFRAAGLVLCDRPVEEVALSIDRVLAGVEDEPARKVRRRYAWAVLNELGVRIGSGRVEGREIERLVGQLDRLAPGLPRPPWLSAALAGPRTGPIPP